ncbi:MAG: MBL fold metallo-hydrolase [Actinomycetota bacterium]|nr:MBL fold metallo-hydrolase [Actinomycetota bacterium]
MRVRFWGTRGSIATPGPSTVRYGGNTVCVEVRSSAGTLLVIDCGTGARLLGRELLEEARGSGASISGSLLISHTHWDHIQGLPFFAPLFQEGAQWDVYGPRGLGQSLATTLEGQMQYQYFPVTLEQMGARVRYHDLLEGRFEIGDLSISAQYLNHPALTLGYRIEGDGVSVVYACDHEPFDPALAGGGGDLDESAPDARHVEFVSGADLLVHDAQYLAAEYGDKRGWGHSTVEYAVAVASLAGVRELVLTHHDPLRTDDALDAVLLQAREQAASRGFTGTVSVAVEGDSREVVQDGRAATPRQPGVPAGSDSAVYQPVARELSAAVLLTAQDPEVATVVRAAAEAESLPLFAGRELPGRDDPHRADGVVVVDHDGDGAVLDRVKHLLSGEGTARLAVLAVTRGHPTATLAGADWLVWPAGVGHVRTKLRAAVLRRACRWQCAPLPPDEGDRLHALRALGVLDTEPEERFDRLTREACRLLDVPFALVSLVDADRQWFKSQQGLAVQQTPRDESLCAHAILEPDVLEVPDLLEDDRFADNPATSAPYFIRFYAGVPLVLSDGSRVGTLCVADRRPRALDADQLDVLRDLAAQVLKELEAARPAG